MIKSLLLCLVVALAAATAYAADVSGQWDVTGMVYNTDVKYVCTLKQEGDKLTGTATLDQGELPVTGTIKDKDVSWQFDIVYNGQPLTLVFTGTLQSDADITGKIAVAGIEGEFTAKKAVATSN